MAVLYGEIQVTTTKYSYVRELLMVRRKKERNVHPSWMSKLFGLCVQQTDPYLDRIIWDPFFQRS